MSKSYDYYKNGVDEYIKIEKDYQHHKLVKLADFIPILSTRDKAALKALTHFIYWAGRYPDPESGRIGDVDEIFNISENHQLSAKDLFELMDKIMSYVKTVAYENS